MEFYLLAFSQDNELHRSIAIRSIMLAGFTIAAYAFGTTCDDADVMRTLRRDPYQGQVPNYSLPPDRRPGRKGRRHELGGGGKHCEPPEIIVPMPVIALLELGAWLWLE